MRDTNENRSRSALMGVALFAAGALTASTLTGVALAAKKPEGGRKDTAAAREKPGKGREGAPGQQRMPVGYGPGKMRGTPLHGDVTVRTPDGAVVDTRMSDGKISAISEASVTVETQDGHVSTYVLAPATKFFLPGARKATSADLSVGIRVFVHGTVTDGTATAAWVGAPPKRGGKAKPPKPAESETPDPESTMVPPLDEDDAEQFGPPHRRPPR